MCTNTHTHTHKYPPTHSENHFFSVSLVLWHCGQRVTERNLVRAAAHLWQMGDGIVHRPNPS